MGIILLLLYGVGNSGWGGGWSTISNNTLTCVSLLTLLFFHWCQREIKHLISCCISHICCVLSSGGSNLCFNYSLFLLVHTKLSGTLTVCLCKLCIKAKLNKVPHSQQLSIEGKSNSCEPGLTVVDFSWLGSWLNRTKQCCSCTFYWRAVFCTYRPLKRFLPTIETKRIEVFYHHST